MLFLALAVACSTAIAVLFKLTEGKMDRTALLAVNYAVALGVGGALVALDTSGGGLRAAPGLLALGVVQGALFIGGFALFSKAIGIAGISLATGTMRLSVALPFVASWLIWGEEPSVAQWAGLLAAFGAFVLIARRPVPKAATGVVAAEPETRTRSAEAWQVALVLASLFLVGGVVDTVMKVFEETYAPQHSRSLFLVVVFGVAFAIGVSLVVARGMRTGEWPRRAVYGWGLALGVVNYASAEFFLMALAELPGTFVFPANNVAIVGLATVLGVVVWRERLSRENQIGLALAALALVLLSR